MGKRGSVRVYVSSLNRGVDSVKHNKRRKQIISEYHTELKQSDQSNKQKLDIDLYQQASDAATHNVRYNNFNTSRWIIQYMTQYYTNTLHIDMTKFNDKQSINLLDVGALSNYYKQYKYINTRAIDINPQHSSVERIDFFDLPYRKLRYDIIVLSLVINFINNKSKRGEMIKRCRHMLNSGKLLYLVLPYSCVNNSRYITQSILNNDIMNNLAFKCINHRVSRNNKLVMYEYVAIDINDKHNQPINPKVIKQGDGFNNFSITIDGTQ